uniref:TPR repeat n=1 Tax=Dechloromonas aromatica (strain RCB) TaxID=159087 RepID=Q47GV5_DECAR
MTAPSLSAEDLFYEGTRLMGLGDVEKSERAFRAAIAEAPELGEAHANLGLLLESDGRTQEAEASYRRALELAPGLSQIHINLGAMLASQRRFAEAENTYREALAVNPESYMAWSNLGVLLACVKREAESEQCYRTAMALAPDYRNASFNLAYLLLRQGRYAEGWLCLESRDWYQALDKHLGIPRWQGEPLAGKSFLISLEAGHGDMIQFCRYARQLKERGAARVSVLCHPALKNLFDHFDGIDEAIAVGDPYPDRAWDCWSPPLSLPFFCQTRLESIPANLPYLSADPDKTRYWASLMADGGDALRVGLVWKGNPRFENDAERSLGSFLDLAPLGEVSGVRFFSLQKGAGENEVAHSSASFPVLDLGSRLADFSDTAAIVMNLDLLITVDTAVAHLAGALGKPVWVMLPDYKTDWRWLSDRSDSPWYPGVMRLFRQEASGTWGSVISRVKVALEEELKKRQIHRFLANNTRD